MKKAILIATLFAAAGIASAQNTAPASAASAPAAKPAATADAAKPAETTAKVAEHKKVHAKKHVKHVKYAAKKADQAKVAGTGTVAKTDPPAAQKPASTPAK